MSVVTVTINPAIDQTVTLSDLTLGVVNRAQLMEFSAGGKGVNVAAILADLGVHVCVTGYLGEENTQIFEKLFHQKDIRNEFLRFPGSTRISVKLVDVAQNTTTDINLPGLPLTIADLERLTAHVLELAKHNEWFVLAGNVQKHLPPDYIASLLAQLHKLGKKTALDTSGEALRLGFAQHPTLVKPNVHELEEVLQRRLSSIEEIASAAQELIAQGIQVVAVSLGADGALICNARERWLVKPPKVQVRSTVGAGDSMVAGLIAGLLKGKSLSECGRLATAVAAAKITTVGPNLPKELLSVLLDQVQLISI